MRTNLPNSTTTTIVGVAAANRDLTTLANVKLNLDIQNQDEDVFLAGLIRQCSGAAESYCGRVFAWQTYSDARYPERDVRPHFLPNDLPAITLAVSPVVSVTSVTEDDTALTVGVDYETDLGTYLGPRPGPGALYRLDTNGDRCRWRARKVETVYVAGYRLPGDTPSTVPLLPAEIEDAVIRMIRGRRGGRTRDPFLRSEENVGVSRFDYWVPSAGLGNMPSDVVDILDNYRTPICV